MPFGDDDFGFDLFNNPNLTNRWALIIGPAVFFGFLALGWLS